MNAKQALFTLVAVIAVICGVWLAVSSLGEVDQKYIPVVSALISGGFTLIVLLINFMSNPLRLELYKRQADAVMALKEAVDQHASNFSKCVENRTFHYREFERSGLEAVAAYQKLILLLPASVQRSFLVLMETFLQATHQLTDRDPNEDYRQFVNTCRRVVGTAPQSAEDLK